jgi:hypothetical protein
MRLLHTRFRIPNALPIYCVMNRPMLGGELRVIRQDRPLISLLFVLFCISKKRTLRKLRQVAPDDHDINIETQTKEEHYALIVNMVQENKRTKRRLTMLDEALIHGSVKGYVPSTSTIVSHNEGGANGNDDSERGSSTSISRSKSTPNRRASNS